MKRSSTTLALALCIGVLASCKNEKNVVPGTETPVKNAVAKYTATVDPVDAFTYSFKNSSENYKRLEWRFGDDSLKLETDPSHTYATTGKYVVDLKAFSETGAESRKFYDVNIIPDTILKIIPTKTSVPKELKLTLDAKFPIASAIWTFRDVNPVKVYNQTTPVNYTFPDNINTFTVTAKSTKGSTVTVTKNNATPEGYVAEITQARTSVTITPTSADNSGSTTENFTKLFDGNRLTKMYKGGFRSFFPNVFFDLTFQDPQKCIFYAVGNANDWESRDPKTWTVQGSNDGLTWTVVDTRTIAKNFKDQAFDKGWNTDNDNEITGWKNRIWYFGITNPGAYKIYRWQITDIWSGNDFQAGEFKLYKQN